MRLDPPINSLLSLRIILPLCTFVSIALTLLPSTRLSANPNPPNLNLSTPEEDATYSTPLTPIRLVTFAYRHGFRDQGIPGAARLLVQYSFRQLTAQDLVQAAIRTNRLPITTLEDTAYLRAVTQELEALLRRSQY